LFSMADRLRTYVLFGDVGRVKRLYVNGATNTVHRGALFCSCAACRVTDPLGRVTKQIYDRVGNVTKSTNAKALNTGFTYDSMNRAIKVDPPVVGATLYTYSPMGYVSTRTDALSTALVPRVATWGCDLGGRLVEKKDAAGRRFTYGYDVANNMTQIVDANANAAADTSLGTTSMSFDTLNRPTQKSYSDGTPTVTYTYDAQGRVSSMTDRVGLTTYGFDAADRVNQITRVLGRDSDTWSYTYDAAGNITGRSLPGGVTTTASFDDAGQVTAVGDAGGTTIVKIIAAKEGDKVSALFYLARCAQVRQDWSLVAAVSTPRESCAIATMGMSSSRASCLRPRAISAISSWRFSVVLAFISCR
jgi:YD repeat-containing protein